MGLSCFSFRLGPPLMHDLLTAGGMSGLPHRAQGMSDLATPLLYVMEDEAEAFWCFAALMDRTAGGLGGDVWGGLHLYWRDERQRDRCCLLKRTSIRLLIRLLRREAERRASAAALARSSDAGKRQSSLPLLSLRPLLPRQVVDPPLHAHLESLDAKGYFFAFRWLLVGFKRELGSMSDVLRVWEAAWACPFSQNLNVYFAGAILVQHRRTLMEQVRRSDLMEASASCCNSYDLNALIQGHDLDELLRLCCQLTGRLHAESLLALAEQLAVCAAKVGEDVEAVEALPAPPPLAGRLLDARGSRS